MKPLILMVCVLMVTVTAQAAVVTKRYVVKRVDNSLAYFQYLEGGSNDSLATCLQDANLAGLPIFGPYTEAQLPLNEPVEWWKMNGVDVVLDVAKKNQAIADQNARDAKIVALRNKLKAAIPGLTDDELDLLKVKKKHGESAS